MIIKFNELKKCNKNNFNFYLFYGTNAGLIEETINIVFKPIFPKNIIHYEEVDILNSVNNFKTAVYNKSFFEDEKFIIINRASNKILDIIQDLINSQIDDVRLIIKAGVLEKKSKLRNFFEKNNSTIITPFYEDSYQSLITMTQKRFRENNIKVSNEIINLLVERSKGDRININNEIKKILSYANSKKELNLQDISKLTNLVENYNISELVDQNLSKNIRKTHRILNENIPNAEENILILRTFLNKLKRLKKIKINLEKNKNIEQVLSSLKPPVFWKDRDLVMQQLSKWSLKEIKCLIYKINDLELLIKKNNLISDQILNNFILENLRENQ